MFTDLLDVGSHSARRECSDPRASCYRCLRIRPSVRRDKCILAVRKRQSMSRGIAVSYISTTPESVAPRSLPPAPLPNKADRRSPVARRAAPQRSSGSPAHLGRANHRAAFNSSPIDAGDLRPTYAGARTALAKYRGFDRGCVRRTDRAKRCFSDEIVNVVFGVACANKRCWRIERNQLVVSWFRIPPSPPNIVLLVPEFERSAEGARAG